MSTLFNGIFDTGVVQTISVENFLLCLGVSLILGLIMAAAYMFKNEHTKSFLVTLALLPAVVCVVIMMVNGNIGAGVAVAGAFSLVRFRSDDIALRIHNSECRHIDTVRLDLCLVCRYGHCSGHRGRSRILAFT